MKYLKLNQLYIYKTDEICQVVILTTFTIKGLIILSNEDDLYEYGYWISYQKIKASKCLIPLDDQLFPVINNYIWERNPNKLEDDI